MIIADRYEYNPETDRLGKGGFGSVFKALDQHTQQYIALKFVPQSKLPTRYSLAEETQRLKSLAHPNLVQYFDVILKEFENIAGEKDLMQIGIMEYVNGGDLGAYMKMPFAREEPKIKSLLIGILEGLAYLHTHKIIHRDIKPQNILLAIEGQQITPKIADFSLSKQLSNELTSVSAAVGTYEYMSPEQLGRGDSKVGITTDIWAFGVLMYQLLTQQLPFGSRRKGDTDGEIVANIIDPQFVPDFSAIAPEFQVIVKRCLAKNPVKRFQNAEEVLALLRPPHTSVQNAALSLTLPEISSFFSEIEEEGNIVPQPIPSPQDPLQTIYKDKEGEMPLEGLPTQYAHHPLTSDLQSTFTQDAEAVEPNSSFEEEVPSKPIEATQLHSKDTLPPRETAFETSRLPKNYASLYAVLVLLCLALLGWAWAKGFFNGKSQLNTDSTPLDSNEVVVENLIDSTSSLKEKQQTLPPISSKNTQTQTSQPSATQSSPTTDTSPPTIQKPNETTTDIPTNTSENPSTNTQTLPTVRYDYEEEGRLGKVVSKNGLYGFIDKNGAILVPLQYQDFAYPQEGLAAVKKGNKWGFINLQNQVVIPFRYDRPGVFRNGRAQVSLGGSDFYIDKNGNPIN